MQQQNNLTAILKSIAESTTVSADELQGELVEPKGTVGVTFHDVPQNIVAFSLEFETRWHLGRVERYMLILSYIEEHAPDHDVDGPGWTVFKECGEWVAARTAGESLEQDLGAPTMPKETADDLAEKMNKGEVPF